MTDKVKEDYHRKLREGRSLAGEDLRDANLQGANLQGANFVGYFPNDEGADLCGANLQGADLRRAEFHLARLIGLKPKDCANYLRGFTPRRTGMIGFFPKDEGTPIDVGVGGKIAYLQGVYLEDKQKKRNFLLYAKIFQMARFNQAKHKTYENYLRKIYGIYDRKNKIQLFSGPSDKYFVHTINLRLEGAKLEGAFFHPAGVGDWLVVQGEAYSAREKVSIGNSFAWGAVLHRANLQKADLREARMGGIDLSGADLRGANLAGACLYGADLRGTKVDGEVDLGLGILEARGGKGCPPTPTTGAADLRGANLCKADLTGADLRGADLRGTDLTKAGSLIAADLGGASTAPHR